MALAMPAYADASAEMTLASGYFDDNAVELSDGAVAQLGLEAALTDWLTIHGSSSVGMTSNQGNEFVGGFTVAQHFGDNTVVSVTMSQYALIDNPDLTEAVFTLSHRQFDISVSQLDYDDGIEDGQRIQVGYNVERGRWSGRIDYTADWGQGYESSQTFGFEAGLALSERTMLKVNVYAPVDGHQFQSEAVTVGLTYEL